MKPRSAGAAAGDAELAKMALQAVHGVLQTPGRRDGLAPIFVDISSATLHGHLITLGARGDSYYEYLLKQWLLGAKKDDQLLE